MQSAFRWAIKTVWFNPFLLIYRCVGSCNTVNDLSDKVCVPNKTRFKSKCGKHDYRSKWI